MLVWVRFPLRVQNRKMMGYKEDFKRRELEHELAGEDEEMMRNMTREELRKYLREAAESEARREKDGY